MKSETKTCQNCKNSFTIEPEDFEFYEKFDLPAPAFCPLCRLRHLFSFWVFGRFRKTKSDLSGKSIITTISDKIKFPIYSREEWFSDKWDAMNYGQEYDFSRSFFDQFSELTNRVPHPHQAGVNNVSCQWSDDVWNSKNCYLCRSLLECEDLSYGYRTFYCKNSVDITYCLHTEFSYDCLYCFNCFKILYSFDCRDCVNSYFLYDCRNVQDSFMCWNLRNKQYHILNRPYSKEEYFQKFKEFNLKSYRSIEELKKKFAEIVQNEAIHRENFNIKVLNSYGNFLTECKNCFFCAFAEKSENCRYVWRAIDCKDLIDTVGSVAENGAMGVLGLGLYDTVATSHSSNCRHSAYLRYCEDCEYCFGCVGLRKKKYCILNRQYTEEGYKELLEKVKDKMKKDGEWGRFFPLSLTLTGYNLSLAHIFFPHTKEDIEGIGGWWENLEDIAQEGLNGDDLLDNIDDVKDDVSAKVIICPETNRRFNIAPQELKFHKEFGIPLPHNHPDFRTLNRFKPLALAVRTFKSSCSICDKEILHYFSPDLGYKKVACVDCYQKEVA